MASMVAKVNSNSCSSHLSSSLLQDKASRNKRKFRGDPNAIDPNMGLPPSLKVGSTFEFSLEKFEIAASHEHPPGACDMCGMCPDPLDDLELDLGLSTAGIGGVDELGGLSEAGSNRPKEDVEVVEFQDADWSDFTESQLEELVLSNLDAIFRSAIKKIASCGYTEEVATKAILRSGLYYGPKDTVSNIVDNALVILNGQSIDSSKEQWFGDLQQLKKYILAELVCVVREVKPSFSTGDAMWCLLICDMNMSHACAMDNDPLSSISNDPSLPQTKPESNIPPPKPVAAVPCPPATKPKKSNVVRRASSPSSCSHLTSLEKPFGVGMTQMHVVEEKLVSGKKIHSTTSKREYTLRQTCRVNGMKGTFRTTKLSGYILDKRGKPITESASLNLKNSSFKLSKALARGLELAHECETGKIASLSSNSTTFTIESKTTITQSTKPVTKPTVLESDSSQTKLSISSEARDPSFKMPYNKVEMITKLVPRVQELECQLREWNEWANQKVMQAAHRLGKDKAELKTLRQEKEEVERLKREKHTLQESTMKKLYEMENALGKASGQIERANAAVQRLKVENTGLRQEMEAAKLEAVESAASCQEASKREKTTSMNFQSWEKEKGVFQEELAVQRRKLSQLQQELEQAKDLRTQLLARLKQEEKAKDELHTQGNLIRKEREQLEASAKSKEDSIRLKAEANLQKYKDNIMKLTDEISQLRLKIDSSKIAALKRGVDGSYAANKLTNSQTSPFNLRDSYKTAIQLQVPSTEGVKRERECVMCLSEEMSVVFIPCAHQVVCKMCNELHEKQGMTECPSCRCPIIRRISSRFARS